jgi:5-methylcytosine-specific restriction endonuclease McrA
MSSNQRPADRPIIFSGRMVLALLEGRKGKEFSPATKVKAYERCGGKCEGCGAALMPGRFAYDHVVSVGLGGTNRLENCAVLCKPCHDAKTHITKGARQTRPAAVAEL